MVRKPNNLKKTLENTEGPIKNGQSRETVNKTKKNKIKTQHNMCWTPLYANKHKFNKLDMNLPTNIWR